MARNSSLVAVRFEEMLLVGRALVGVAGRDRDAVDAELRHVVEERGDAARGPRR